ncbi:hypothetical protein PC9H_008242 [Pleurotus ostreatus]|uniref:Uncharacterized protein n=1 Tax=Pleurotus ostreatus TaxID=5322 RepID=A0A8H7DSF1_PLEOS|nr:uncharacterized protein PC9H_008242 [Pleurotus ostreatus]KAF7429004.1 hypothetical protein PC9H_008242 [Pleurotus ostreatus]
MVDTSSTYYGCADGGLAKGCKQFYPSFSTSIASTASFDSTIMVFFPDNVSRRDRALQLQDDIVSLQKSAIKLKDAMDKQDDRMVPYINEYLEKNGMASFSELQDKLAAALTPEQQKQYQDLVDNSAKAEKDNKIAIIAITTIALSSGIIAGSIKTAILLRAASLMEVLRAYARAFVTLVTEGVEAGLRAFNLAAIAARWVEGQHVLTHHEINLTASWDTESVAEATEQVAGYAANASRYLGFLSIVGILSDGFILVYTYFSEKEQKEELQKAIKELYVSRIVAKVFAQMCDAINTESGLMLSYMILVGDSTKTTSEDQQAADKIADGWVQHVKDAWSEITTTSSLDLLILLDKQRGSWLNDDPSYQDAIAAADDKIKADPPQSGAAVAKINTAKAVKAAAHSVAAAHDEFWPQSMHHLSAAVLHVEDLRKEKLKADLKSVIKPTIGNL